MVLAAAVAGVLAVSPSPGCGPYTTRDVSVLDAKHRWRVIEDESFRCRDAVLATDDGGKTWRTIYRAPRTVNRGTIAPILRTSVRAGVIFPPHLRGYRRPALVTTNGGRTWKRTGAIGRSNADFAIAGRGDRVYEVSRFGIARITNWPRGPLSRRFVWRDTPALHLAALYRPPWFAVHRTSTGIVTVAAPRVAAPQTLAVVRVTGSRVRTQLLPDASRWITDTGGNAVRDDDVSILIRGRRIEICAIAARQGPPKAIDVGTVGWESRDGGATWDVVAACSPTFPDP